MKKYLMLKQSYIFLQEVCSVAVTNAIAVLEISFSIANLHLPFLNFIDFNFHYNFPLKNNSSTLFGFSLKPRTLKIIVS